MKWMVFWDDLWMIVQGLGLMSFDVPIFGDWSPNQPYLWQIHIPNSWVMWNITGHRNQPLLFNGFWGWYDLLDGSMIWMFFWEGNFSQFGGCVLPMVFGWYLDDFLADLLDGSMICFHDFVQGLFMMLQWCPRMFQWPSRFVQWLFQWCLMVVQWFSIVICQWCLVVVSSYSKPQKDWS